MSPKPNDIIMSRAVIQNTPMSGNMQNSVTPMNPLVMGGMAGFQPMQQNNPFSGYGFNRLYGGMQSPFASQYGGYQPQFGGFGGYQPQYGGFGGYQPQFGGFGGYQPQFGGYGGYQPQYGGFGGYQPQFGGFGGYQPQFGGFGGYQPQFGGYGGYQPSFGGFGASQFSNNIGGLLGGLSPHQIYQPSPPTQTNNPYGGFGGTGDWQVFTKMAEKPKPVV